MNGRVVHCPIDEAEVAEVFKGQEFSDALEDFGIAGSVGYELNFMSS